MRNVSSVYCESIDVFEQSDRFPVPWVELSAMMWVVDRVSENINNKRSLQTRTALSRMPPYRTLPLSVHIKSGRGTCRILASRG